MREKAVEEYLREQVKAAGGKAYKFVSPGNVGVPDRLVLLPGGRTYFVELKAPGKKPTALQQVQIAKLNSLGFQSFIIDSKQGVDEFIANRSKPFAITCACCGTQIGVVDEKGCVNVADNYNVCEQCGEEICGNHCVEKETDFWVCINCAKEG